MPLISNRKRTCETGFCPQPKKIYDNATLDELFARNRTRLYKTALRVIGKPEDAEDALQDGLISGYRNLSAFEGRSQLSAWLTRIVVNAALMRLRWLHSRHAISLDQRANEDNLPLVNTIADVAPNPEELYVRAEQLDILERQWRRLPTKYRKALWFCAFKEMTIKEAAETLGIPAGTLKTHVHRARQMLRQGIIKPQSSRGVPRRAQMSPSCLLSVPGKFIRPITFEG